MDGIFRAAIKAQPASAAVSGQPPASMMIAALAPIAVDPASSGSQWRLSLRMTHGAPPAPDAEPEPLRKASHLAHWAFYALLAVIPISGAVATSTAHSLPSATEPGWRRDRRPATW